MLSSFKPILLTHIVTLIITSDNQTDNITVTALLKGKDEKDDYQLQVSGPFAEVEAGLVAEITNSCKAIAALTTTSAALDVQIAEAKKAKEALLKAELAAAKKKTPVQCKSASVPASIAKDDDDDDEDEDEKPVVTRRLDRPAPKPVASSAPSTAGLVPAMSVQSDLGDLGI